jgi:hypothetical protein
MRMRELLSICNLRDKPEESTSSMEMVNATVMFSMTSSHLSYSEIHR